MLGPGNSMCEHPEAGKKELRVPQGGWEVGVNRKRAAWEGAEEEEGAFELGEAPDWTFSQ